MNKITIKELKANLQKALDNLNNFNDDDVVDTCSNTYFVKSDYFIALGRYGYCPLFNVTVESADNEDDKTEE
jgi:hypothetical protein